MVCKGTELRIRQSEDIIKNFCEELRNKGLDDVEVMLTSCFGFCGEGPIVKVQPDNVFYVHIRPEGCLRNS